MGFSLFSSGRACTVLTRLGGREAGRGLFFFCFFLYRPIRLRGVQAAAILWWAEILAQPEVRYPARGGARRAGAQ